MTYSLSRVYRSTPVLMLVLSGIIVGALFSSSTSLIKYVADPVNEMPSIVFWLLGSLNNASNRDMVVVGADYPDRHHGAAAYPLAHQPAGYWAKRTRVPSVSIPGAFG